MFKVFLLMNLLVGSVGYASEKGQIRDRMQPRPYNCPRPCAMGCGICCKTMSWVSWGCGICCWLPKICGEMPAITRKTMAISQATENAANYFKAQCGEGK